jgi:hypothetical protein
VVCTTAARCSRSLRSRPDARQKTGDNRVEGTRLQAGMGRGGYSSRQTDLQCLDFRRVGTGTGCPLQLTNRTTRGKSKTRSRLRKGPALFGGPSHRRTLAIYRHKRAHLPVLQLHSNFSFVTRTYVRRVPAGFERLIADHPCGVKRRSSTLEIHRASQSWRSTYSFATSPTEGCVRSTLFSAEMMNLRIVLPGVVSCGFCSTKCRFGAEVQFHPARQFVVGCRTTDRKNCQ